MTKSDALATIDAIPRVIGIDVDEVVADLHAPWIRWLNRRYDTQWDVRRGFETWNEPTDLYGPEALNFICPEIYDRDIVKPFPMAVTTVNQVRGMWRRQIVWSTSCINGTAAAKLSWLTRNGLMRPGDIWYPVGKGFPEPTKRNTPASVLVDDALHSLEVFPKIGILMTRPHNQNEPYAGRRINSIEELPDALLAIGEQIKAEKGVFFEEV